MTNWINKLFSGRVEQNEERITYEGVARDCVEIIERHRKLSLLHEQHLQHQLEHPETMTTNHPDYMRIRVHTMD